VPVGTGRRVQEIVRRIRPELQIDVASNPEFLREGNAIGDFMRPDRVVIGVESERAEKLLERLYRPLYLIETPVVVTSIETAELIKYAANAFLAVKITFINQIADLCENAGADVTYSGTIAGAIEGTLLGVPSIALSLCLSGRKPATGHWDTPIAHAPALIKRLVDGGWPADVLINLNFPDCPPSEVLPAMVTRQSTHEDTLWNIQDRTDGRGQPYFWVGYEGRDKHAPEGTDIWAMQRNHISVTPLHLDLTHDATLAKLKKQLGG